MVGPITTINVGYKQAVMLGTTSNYSNEHVVIITTTDNDGYEKTVTPSAFMYQGLPLWLVMSAMAR